MTNFEEKLRQARESSWEKFGKSLTFYIPGMFRTDHMAGKYSAISITGGYCALQCDHCAGKLLETMIWATTADELVRQCVALYEKGHAGVLLSGGCDAFGCLPWAKFIPAIWEIKQRTNLYISVHCGLLDERTAFDLKAAGVDQALIDVIGHDETLQRVYHVSFGISRIIFALEALAGAGLDIAPHVVCGLHFGEMKGEKHAIELISRFPVKQVVVVSLMKIPGTPAANFKRPGAADVADIIAHARLAMPQAAISLGCARERGNRRMEMMAIDAGVNKMALPSEEAVMHAKNLGLEIIWQPTCCCVSKSGDGQNSSNEQ
jgi:lipoyl synthase